MLFEIYLFYIISQNEKRVKCATAKLKYHPLCLWQIKQRKKVSACLYGGVLEESEIP